jgi:uncharacterized OB-fold protein
MSSARLEAYVDEEEINLFRAREGLSPIKSKRIKCLKCGSKFESKDFPRVRMCGRCRVVDTTSHTYEFSRGINIWMY